MSKINSIALEIQTSFKETNLTIYYNNSKHFPDICLS